MKTDREHGLTLIEIIVSILIAGIAFAALSMAFSTGLMAIRATRETSIAVQAAQHAMETIRNTPFGGVQTDTFPIPSLNTNGTIVVEQEDTDLKKVSINVSWVSSSSRSMSISLLTRITPDGISRQ